MMRGFNELLKLRDGMYSSTIFITAIHHLDLFNYLNFKHSTLAEIVSALKIKKRPADVMLTYLMCKGLIKKNADKYVLTSLSKKYLVKGSELDISSYYLPVKNAPLCLQMLSVLRTDIPANWDETKNIKDWHTSMLNPEFAYSFTDAMDKRGRSIAPYVAQELKREKFKKILDIGGGSGIYSIKLVRTIANSKATIIEKPPMDIVVKEYIKKHNLKTINVLGLDFLKQDLPKGFDMHLYSHVLHDWDNDIVEKLLKKSYESLNAGGTLVICDGHLNNNKTAPLEVAELSVLLMFLTRGKCYSFKELKDILLKIGFKDIKYVDLKFAYRSLIIARKYKKVKS